MIKSIGLQVIRTSTVCFISKRTGKMNIGTMFDVSKMSRESTMLIRNNNEIYWV